MKVGTGTIIRTICLLLALTNQILVMTGHSILPIEDEVIEMLITNTATVVTSLAAWWRNNSFTKKAIEADQQLHNKKS